MNRAGSKTLLLPAGLAVLLCLALFVRAGLALAGPQDTGAPGSPVAGLVLALAAFLAVLWTFLLAKSLAAAAPERTSSEDSRTADTLPTPAPEVQPAPPPRPVAATPGGAPAEVPGAEALMLISLLQEKGRFVDFVMEDISGYSNEQVGAVARVVHQGCRTVVQEAFSPLPVAPAENARITLEPGYDAEEFRLVGSAGGAPPITVKVTHKGWRARHVKLPRRIPADKGNGAEAAAANPVIVPAEVTV